MPLIPIPGNKKFLSAAISFVILGLIVAVYIFYTTTKKPYIEISGKKIRVLLADNDRDRIQGLSDRPALDQESGMLFIFDKKAYKTFWMKRMQFPLDIIWIKDNKIIKIDKNLAPEGDEPSKKYHSGDEVNYVLEVNGGFSDKNNIKVGDPVGYNLY